jgi:DHA1 family tetracycline resistance protein-like MFS transporter
VVGGVFLALALLVFVTRVAKPTPKEMERMHAEEAAAAGGH